MYTRTNFGSFYPVDSVLHNLNSVAKIFNFLIVILSLILCDSLYIMLLLLIFVVILMFLSYVPIRYYFNTFYSLRYLYIGLALVCAYIGYSLNDYLLLMVKIIIFFEYVNILTFTTSSSESVYAIEKFLNLFNIFYLDVTPAAFSINNMLRYNPLYNNVKINVMNASLSRGIVYNKLNIKNRIKLHSNVRRLTKIKSKQILEESKLRLFDIKKRRTNFRTNKLSGYDLFCILFHIVLLYCVLVSGGYL